VGALTLPAAGAVYVDANAVIYAVEKIEPYRSLLEPLWSAAQAGRLRLITSELTWLETLTKPLREGNALLEALFAPFSQPVKSGLFPPPLRSGKTRRACAPSGSRLPTPSTRQPRSPRAVSSS
jgi:hypothetical protein